MTSQQLETGPQRPVDARDTAAAQSWSSRTWGLLACCLVLAILVVLSLAVGSKNIPVATVWHTLFRNDGTLQSVLVNDVRLPRTVLGLLVGAALALSGALMQALSRNPLADPGILGVNAGAALAVVAAISFLGLDTLTGYVWFALLGAGLATVFGYALGSAGRGGASPIRLALAGAAITAVLTGFTSALVLTNIKAFGGFRDWSVGALAGRDMSVVWQVLPFLLPGVALSLLMARSLNALALGDDTARALGAKVATIRLTGVLATTLLCGAATAAVGPISFVGLVVPHIARSITGPDNRWLMAYCLVLGPILMLGSDILGRVVIRPGELQTSIITALVGAPVFIALVRRRKLAEL